MNLSQGRVRYYEVEEFAKQHREMDLAHYGKPYDDQDRYQLKLTGGQGVCLQFVQDLKQESAHSYIQFKEALVDLHIRKLKESQGMIQSDYIVTLYHVGSRYGQKHELKGWLEWMEQKKAQYEGLDLTLQFKHVSSPDLFILKNNPR